MALEQTPLTQLTAEEEAIFHRAALMADKETDRRFLRFLRMQRRSFTSRLMHEIGKESQKRTLAPAEIQEIIALKYSEWRERTATDEDPEKLYKRYKRVMKLQGNEHCLSSELFQGTRGFVHFGSVNAMQRFSLLEKLGIKIGTRVHHINAGHYDVVKMIGSDCRIKLIKRGTQQSPLDYEVIDQPIVEKTSTGKKLIAEHAPANTSKEVLKKQSVVTVLTLEENGKLRQRRMVIRQNLASDLQSIFCEAIKSGFPITSVRSFDDWVEINPLLHKAHEKDKVPKKARGLLKKGHFIEKIFAKEDWRPSEVQGRQYRFEKHFVASKPKVRDYST